jgi:hypothetical protein
LQEALTFIASQNDNPDIKAKNKLLKEKLNAIAQEMNIELGLRHAKN